MSCNNPVKELGNREVKGIAQGNMITDLTNSRLRANVTSPIRIQNLRGEAITFERTVLTMFPTEAVSNYEFDTEHFSVARDNAEALQREFPDVKIDLHF